MEITCIFIQFFTCAKEAFSSLTPSTQVPPHAGHRFRLQQCGRSAKCSFSFPNPCGSCGGFSPLERDKLVAVSSQTLLVGETFPTTECQLKARWEDNKLCAPVTCLALGHVLLCGPVVGPALRLQQFFSLSCGVPWHWARLEQVKVQLPTHDPSCYF